MRREPIHSTPLVGAGFAVALSAMVSVGAFVVSARSGEPAWIVWGFLPAGAAFALLLGVCDLGVLRLVGLDRPREWRRRWRRMWLVAPAIGAAVGLVTGLLYEMR